ncbi:MAG: cyclase/dehydrase, partial [Bacteroidota bacterium]
MVEFEVTTWIAAPPAVCFDLARDVDFHAESLAHTGERVVDRPGHRLLELEDEVEFEGRHFGVVQRHRARITALEVPNFFRDEMVRGAFR